MNGLVISYIRKRLELKIILTLSLVIACMVGVFTLMDIRNMRADMIRTSERTLGAFAAAIKGSVNASMKKGHHQDVRNILEEVNTPLFIDRVMIYNAEGRPLYGREKLHGDSRLDMNLRPEVLKTVMLGDMSDIREQDDNHFISYYSPIANQPECFRCHAKNIQINGILRVDFSLRDLDDLITSRRRRVIAWSVVLTVLLTLVLVALLRYFVYRPVKELRDAMANVRDGRDPLLRSPEGEDELADLKKSFITMLHRIQTLHATNLESEKELARNQETMRFRAELQTMFDAMQDGVLLIDKDMNIVQSNPRVYELLPGLKNVNGRIPPERIKEESCPHHGVQEAFKTIRVGEHQCSVKLPHGEVRHVHSICAPIVEEGGVRYVVEVIRDISERVRIAHELEEKKDQLLEANKLLSRIAITDSLTQVFNRRHFDELLAKEIKRYNRKKYAHLSLMMIDIDHFKKLNDEHGHPAGDAVLHEIAALLKDNVRETDTVARYGGEEFVVIMPDTHLDGAAYRAEVLRKKVQDRNFTGHAAPIKTTISIGVAAHLDGAPQDLVHNADQALYQAKRAGRNTVVVSRLEEVKV